MQSVKMASGNAANGLTELLSELRGHLYLYAGTFFLKMVHIREYQEKLGVQWASLCYLLAYEVSPSGGIFLLFSNFTLRTLREAESL